MLTIGSRGFSYLAGVKDLLRKILLWLWLAVFMAGTVQAGMVRCKRLKAGTKKAFSLNKSTRPPVESQEQAAEICGTGSQYALRENESISLPLLFHVSAYLVPRDDRLNGEDHSILHFPPPRI